MANYIVSYDTPYGEERNKFIASNFTELYIQLHYPTYRPYKAIYTEIDMIEFEKLGKLSKLKRWLNDRGYHQTNLADDILKVLDL